jgi:ribulose-5-phosphate 4-epimerase/fuculose-1-phosphate aldolase
MAAAATDGPELRADLATACRILARRGLVDGILGHVSARVAEDELVVRCRGPEERGLAFTAPSDVWRVRLDGQPVDVPEGWHAPNELAIHTQLMRDRPEVGAVVHAHPSAALLAGLAGLAIRPVFGAFNIPAMRLARAGVPVYRRPILITRPELAAEMVEAMDGRSVCLLAGHGIAVAARTVEEATVMAADLHVLLTVTVELARLGAHPPELTDDDLAELPDLGSEFNTMTAWRALVAELEG